MNLSTTRSLRSLENAEPTEEENSFTGKIIGAAIDVHRILGPGLLINFNMKLLREGIRRFKI